MCSWLCLFFVFFLNDTATTEIYTDGHTLSLHDALPISDAFGAEIGDHDPLAERVGEIDFRAVAVHRGTVGDREPCGTSGCDAAAVEKIKTPARRAFRVVHRTEPDATPGVGAAVVEPVVGWLAGVDRKSTRLNSSH